ncbi:DoxX family protein [Candidatus Binatia bacterium]|nr:DoxX family protein [Candidatus Binatia bacterium]
MAASRVQIFAIWVLTTLLVALFVLAGGGKLAATEQAAAEFARFGYPQWFMLLIGALELLAGLSLLFPRSALPGALTLVPVMAGAVWTHWRLGEPVLAPATAGGMLALLAWLRWTTGAAPRAPVAGDARRR